MDREIKRNNLKYETNKYIYDFKKSEMIRSFGDSNFRNKIKIREA